MHNFMDGVGGWRLDTTFNSGTVHGIYTTDADRSEDIQYTTVCIAFRI